MAGDGLKSAVWNLLHDGGIDSVSGRVPGEVTFLIGIQYLCAMLPTQAEQLQLRLIGCSSARVEALDGRESSELGDVIDWEILSAEESDAGVVEVCCVRGMLRLEYEGWEMRLMEGRVVPLVELEAAASRYWREWEAGRLNNGDVGAGDDQG